MGATDILNSAHPKNAFSLQMGHHLKGKLTDFQTI